MCYDAEARPPIRPIAGGSENAREITLRARDGTRLRAFAARAALPGGAGMVVLPDVRGLHRFYEELAQRFAENGIDAVAIDYFGRTDPNGKRDDAFDWQPHVAATLTEATREDVCAAVEHLRSPAGGAVRSVFTAGFCFGGLVSWLQTANGFGLAGAIGFYGRPYSRFEAWPSPIDRVQEFASPILGLFGGDDPAIPAEVVTEFDRALTKAGVEHEFVSYPGAPHSFFDRRQTEYASESADAWRRTLDFVAKHNTR